MTDPDSFNNEGDGDHVADTTVIQGTKPSPLLEFSSFLKNRWLRYGQGGSLWDSFLLEAAQQIGQSVLTLPWIFGLMGYVAGSILLLTLSVVSMYTQFLLMSLLAQYRQRLTEDVEQVDGSKANSLDKSTPSVEHDRDNVYENTIKNLTKKARDEHYIASYHEVILYLIGPFWGYFSLLTVFLALLGLSTVQIISTASNLYLLQQTFDKRTLSLILGVIFSSLCLIPTFRHYRILSFLALAATTYTAWYMTITSAIEGPQPDVIHNDAPVSAQGFFTGFIALLFMFGGHTAAVEKADVMDDRKKYDRAYVLATVYVYTITLPNGITGYHTYGSDVRDSPNGFYLFPDSVWRTIGIVLMSLHEFVAFGLFCGPIFHMWEKWLFGSSHPSYVVLVLCRLPVVWFMVFLAVAVPFFGVINGFLGAFTTTFGSFIIPAVCYNLYFRPSTIQNEVMAKPLPLGLGLRTVRILNWLVVVLVLVFGVVMGGWCAMKTLISEIETFDAFAACFDC